MSIGANAIYPRAQSKPVALLQHAQVPCCIELRRENFYLPRSASTMTQRISGSATSTGHVA
jgi:hypothetical protein